jgi:hypothetical protein
MLCQKIIWTGERSNTYCMLEVGHEGKCLPAKVLPEIEKKQEEKKVETREDVLSKYGPYSSDDPRSHREF